MGEVIAIVALSIPIIIAPFAIGFRVARQGKHIVGTRVLVIPRHNPVHAITMGNVVRDAGLTSDQFRLLL